MLCGCYVLSVLNVCCVMFVLSGCCVPSMSSYHCVPQILARQHTRLHMVCCVLWRLWQ